ncbi:hypothetical protein ES705_06614 [subsurface metagenome]
MRIINLKRAIIILLMIGILAVVSGCARWPDGPGPGPGPETDYQLEITVEVVGEIDPDNGIYYIGLNPDGDTKPGPDSYLDSWQGEYYYIKLDNWGCNLYSKDENALPISLDNYSYNGNELKIKFFLSDLGEVETSIDVNVVTADSNDSVYDYLDDCINISTMLYTEREGISLNDLEEDEADFDIREVFVKITNI